VLGSPNGGWCNSVESLSEGHWIHDNGATNVLISFMNLSSYNIPSGSYLYSGLEAETNYTYYFELQYDTNGETFYLDSEYVTFTTYYENAFDDIWDNMLQGSTTAKLLLGFVVLLGIIFFGVAVFGKYNMNLGVYGIMIFSSCWNCISNTYEII